MAFASYDKILGVSNCTLMIVSIEYTTVTKNNIVINSHSKIRFVGNCISQNCNPEKRGNELCSAFVRTRTLSKHLYRRGGRN